jgi:DNA invertase Pin-like site-specific DNA recombinase
MNLMLEDNLHSSILIMVLGMAAEIQRHLIRSNVKAALQRRAAKGLKIGRQPGSKQKKYYLDSYKDLIEDMVEQKQTIAYIADVLQVSRDTLTRYVNRVL